MSSSRITSLCVTDSFSALWSWTGFNQSPSCNAQCHNCQTGSECIVCKIQRLGNEKQNANVPDYIKAISPHVPLHPAPALVKYAEMIGENKQTNHAAVFINSWMHLGVFSPLLGEKIKVIWSHPGKYDSFFFNNLSMFARQCNGPPKMVFYLNPWKLWIC